MIYKKSTDEKGIRRISRSTNINNEKMIDWDSPNIRNYLVIKGPKTEDILLTTDNNVGVAAAALLEKHEGQLMSAEKMQFSESGICIYTLNFAQKIQEGGFVTNGNPGTYAVYGVCEENGQTVIYISENNTIRYTLEIEVQDEPVYEYRGVFVRRKQYTGCHKLTIERGMPGIDPGTVYYSVSEVANVKYPIPSEVIARGGSIYIKCEENEKPDVGSVNVEGVSVRIRSNNHA